MTQLTFKRIVRAGSELKSFSPTSLVLGGWAARDAAAVQHHIDELAAYGVKAPSTTPIFYRCSASLVSQTDTLEVLGPHTSGEIEWVLLAMDDGLWVTVGSDQTDREAEAHGVALSKQLAGKVLAREAWAFKDVEAHFDDLILEAHVVIGGKRVAYQRGRCGELRSPQEMIERYTGGGQLAPGTVFFSGTLNAIGGVRPGERFEMRLADPVLGREMTATYGIAPLPVIA
jgi:hypothetical protein